ncbi:alpha-amylase domain-containing protein [[Eubacterium] cellulosolvens]
MNSKIKLLLILTLFCFPMFITTDYRTLASSGSDIPKEGPFKKVIDKNEIISFGDKVMLQAFYWEYYKKVPDNGKWWSTLKDLIPELVDVGFDSIWAPPPVKTAIGDVSSMGYEPYDLYDVGEFDQKGRVRTRYGTRAELEAFISEANNNDIGIIADIVMNHNVGNPEFNPFTGTTTNTNFMNVSSGKFLRNYTHFWPNSYGTSDNYAFGTLPDLCHAHPYVHDELIKWGTWLRDEIGFDGWRFDVAMGIDPHMIRDWMQSVGGFAVAEHWDWGSNDTLIPYLDETNNTVNAFDFILMYEFRSMILGNGKYDMRQLQHPGLLDQRKDQRITFVVNHDTVRQEITTIPRNRKMCYAYIMTHEGYPCVYWLDYFDLDLQSHIKTLIKIHNEYAKGDTSVLHADDDTYVAQRNGEPGLIVGLNDNPNDWKEVTVQSKWNNIVLTELTGLSSNATVDAHGNVLLKIPPMSYAVWSTGEQLAALRPDKPDPENHTPPSIVPRATIEIDGQLDEIWDTPFYIDSLGDASYNYRDLNYMYLSNDDEYLYIGFSVGRHVSHLDDDVQYGLAFDVRTGGGVNDPWIHSKIRWANNIFPDFIYYFDTTTDPHSWPIVKDLTKYAYDDSKDSWNEGELVESQNYAFNNILGLLEVKIPLEDIDMSNGGNVSLMGFSTVDKQLTAADSVPNDRYVYPDGSSDQDSWLTLPEKITIIVEAQTQPKTSSFTFPTILVIVTLVLINRFKKKRAKE